MYTCYLVVSFQSMYYFQEIPFRIKHFYIYIIQIVLHFDIFEFLERQCVFL